MKKILLLYILLPQSFFLFAQHCPWDCSGMILLQTNVKKDRLYKLDPVLVDENKNEISDTMYGTGKDTHDPCSFLFYDDFTAYRIQRIKIHHWYQYDTVYYFAKGLFMVKYNFCNYEGRKLFLRFTDPYSTGLTFHYIEIPDSLRIHLHNYSNELFAGRAEVTRKKIQPFILKVNCEAFFFRKDECLQ